MREVRDKWRLGTVDTEGNAMGGRERVDYRPADLDRVLALFQRREVARVDACDVIGFYPGQRTELVDERTPPELRACGKTGVDGEHMGPVVHAPELGGEDWPWGTFCPMDSDGVRWLGDGTRQALELLMSFHLDGGGDAANAVRAKVVAALGIKPSAGAYKVWYAEDGSGKPVRPTLPAGWAHVLTSDGIGVAAPREAFSPGQPEVSGVPAGHAEAAAAARGFLRSGHAAAALLVARERLWALKERGATRELRAVMAEAYDMLGRKLYAEEMREGWVRKIGR
jgi:hypothetical protein